jgi:hypothetical protein
MILTHFGIAASGDLVAHVVDVWRYAFETLSVDGHLETNALQALFDGRVPEGAPEGSDWALLANCIRFGVLLCFSASVGLAPEGDDATGMIEFLNDQGQHAVLPSNDPRLSEAVDKTDDFVISMTIFETFPEIIRYSRTEVHWSVLEMERECVRAFWANEAKNLLFDEVTSSERPGIQFDSRYLRNITNQSCNPPIGYPVVLSNVVRSLSKQ